MMNIVAKRMAIAALRNHSSSSKNLLSSSSSLIVNTLTSKRSFSINNTSLFLVRNDNYSNISNNNSSNTNSNGILATTTTTPTSTPTNLIQDAAVNANIDVGVANITLDAAEKVFPTIMSYTPVGLTEYLLEVVNYQTGLPWWLTIISSTIMLRFITFPVTVKQRKDQAAMAIHSPEINRIVTIVKDPTTDENTKAKASMELTQIYKTANPLKLFLPILINGPIFFSFFLATRDMGMRVTEFKTGGAFWFTDLMVSDPLYILPVVNSLLFFVNIKTGADSGVPLTEQGKTIQKVFTFLSVAMIPITVNLSSSTMVYMTTSSAYSLLQQLVLKIPSVRASLNIPSTATIANATLQAQSLKANPSSASSLPLVSNLTTSPSTTTKSTATTPVKEPFVPPTSDVFSSKPKKAKK